MKWKCVLTGNALVSDLETGHELLLKWAADKTTPRLTPLQQNPVT